MGGRKGGGRRETSMGGWGEGERKREGGKRGEERVEEVMNLKQETGCLYTRNEETFKMSC